MSLSRRCLVLVTTTSYRTDAFLEAARRLGGQVVIGSDRCHQLAELWPDDAFKGAFDNSIQLDYRDPENAAARIVSAARDKRIDAVVATDDTTAVVAALAARALGLRGNDPAATQAARNKAEMRRRLRAAGVSAPTALVFEHDAPAAEIAAAVVADFGFPCVVKPLLLSASRGVIRADDETGLFAALARAGAILRTHGEFADNKDPDWRRILVEAFVPGFEVAVEGLLRRGALRTLAIYDKPDPLDGPFFEETIYVTPSRHPVALQQAIERTTADAARALGLSEGPIHAELRCGPDGPQLIEIAARSIGGLCARTLRFTLGGDGGHALEELVLRRALDLDGPGDDALKGATLAAGVMMIPVPHGGVLRAVDGVEDARQVPLVEDVVITARPGEHLVPLPEGSSYPGFIFARGEDPASVERALREAYAKLRFTITPLL